MSLLPKISRIAIYVEHTKSFSCLNFNAFHNINKFNVCPTFSSSFSSVKQNFENDNKQSVKEIIEPKKTLWKVVNEAFAVHQNPNIKPSVSIQEIEHGEAKQKMWQVTINMTWPSKFQVESIASKKLDAEKQSFLLACLKMKDLGVLDKDNNPVLPEKVVAFDDNNVENSKSVLCNIYERIWTRYGRKEYIPKFKTVQTDGLFGKEKYWRSELALTYPEPKTFEAFAGRLRDAERIVSAKALSWLKELGLINKKKRLILYSRDDDVKLMELHSSPYSLCIPHELQDEMNSMLKSLNDRYTVFSDDVFNETPDKVCHDSNSVIYDIITEKPIQEISEVEIHQRSQEMFDKNTSLMQNKDPFLEEIKSTRLQLPIFNKREDIIQLVNENQVVVISGETGCGKTTQVPQFILDHFVNKMEGAHCNVVVTQPRRISAISMAERVAAERGEKVGETVGHQVRLNKMLPSQKGAILYCSTGMLLRKLCSNPCLEGVSHVIVDEVHERSIQIDFLLILLKRLLETNNKIKLIIMSASFNTVIFSNYFNKCPVIHVPGRNYPVKDYYLDDLLTDKIEYKKDLEKKDPILDADLVVDILSHIDKLKKPGAILCFLPGWNDILNVKNKLLTFHPNPSKLMVCCAHSRLPHEEQRRLFNKPPIDVRKIILATNVAETSITVNDVVYVVDTGLHKETSFDSEQAVASLGTQWITKANVRQRSGRAGRVQPGVCYHLFTRKVLMKMDDYPLPELLRMPLESVILDCKRYCPESKAEDFLSCALHAPSKPSLQAGVEELQIIGILDGNEQLTDLGKVVVNFGTHPRLSVALVYATFLRCLDPVLTICSILTLGKEPFLNTLEDKSLVKNIKRSFDNFMLSDHLALAKIFDEWKRLENDSNLSKFMEQNFLDEQSLNVISDLKSLFAENLHTAGLIEFKDDFCNPKSECNENSNHAPSIFAALAVAFHPNVMKVLQGEISQNRLNKDAVIYSLLKGQKGYIQKESVASNESELPSPWLIYFSALQSKARRLMMTSAVSSIPGIILPLVSGRQLTVCKMPSSHKESDNECIMLDEHKKLNFTCSKEEAELIMQFRSKLDFFFDIYIHSLNTKSEKCDQAISLFYNKVFPVLKKVLNSPQVPFTKGQIYKFVNNSLVSEDL